MDGADRGHAHDLGLEAAGGCGDHPRARLQAELLRPLLAGQQRRGGAVVQRAGVSRGHAAALLAEGGLQLRELLERGARARAVVLRHGPLVGRLDRHDLAVEEPAVARLDREVLRALGVLVHVLAGHVEAVSHVLRGLAHLDVGVVRPVAALELGVLGVRQRGLAVRTHA